jgi:hypothetical protein
MENNSMDDILENDSLKTEFVIRNLDLYQVFCATPDDLALENRRMTSLLEWVDRYQELGSREKMEAEGFLFPPIEPDYSPDNDWFLFERWIKGLPVRLRLGDQLSGEYFIKNPDDMDDATLAAELELLTNSLAKVQISVDLNDGIPAQLVYAYLLERLQEEFELMIEGTVHLDGCSGYCPDCFQRPWCEFGNQSCWSEDEQIGEMYVTDSVKKYLSASPVSLEILRKCQAETDKEFRTFRNMSK